MDLAVRRCRGEFPAIGVPVRVVDSANAMPCPSQDRLLRPMRIPAHHVRFLGFDEYGPSAVAIGRSDEAAKS
jgi:hypothetical protein